VLTEDDRSYYRKFGVKNCIVIPNAIHTQTFDISNKENIVCSIGRIEHVKGFDLLIQAFSLIAKDAPNWKLRILGDGSQRKNLMDKIIELKLSDQIQMPGMCNTVEKELARSSIYVLSSRSEGFGLTLLEAMNAKNAVVAFKLPFAEEILTSESATLVTPGNVDKLAEAIREMIFDERNGVISALLVEGFQSSDRHMKGNLHLPWNSIVTIGEDLIIFKSTN
jgi:glycosyltransferase involved in cell wall biosynthesis